MKTYCINFTAKSKVERDIENVGTLRYWRENGSTMRMWVKKNHKENLPSCYTGFPI
jgi:hypothetical protein